MKTLKEYFEKVVFDHLNRVYIQDQDERQKSMGLQYMTAETHDLARFVVRCILDHKMPNPSKEPTVREIVDLIYKLNNYETSDSKISSTKMGS